MKKLNYLALLIFIPVSALFAGEMRLPTGQFTYSKSEVTHLREVRVFSIETEEGVAEYEKLKRKGYICRELPVLMSRCYKFLEDIGSVEIPLEEVAALTPKFGKNYKTQLISRSNYLIKLKVIQKVEAPYGKVSQYDLYLKEGDDQFMEITFQNEPFYYQFDEEDLETLYLRRSYRKRTGDNRYLEYGVRSIYLKI